SGRPPASSEVRVQKCHHTDRPGTQETSPPLRCQKSPARPHHSLLAGSPGGHGSPQADLLISHGGKGRLQQIKALQQPGAGLPDPDGASAMNAAPCPAQHTA
ncbi:MAG: hypothetical protein E6788_03195, partial [Propionibacterium sp.]|nr:hypothetical protein [Propionibacterium sp.]